MLLSFSDSLTSGDFNGDGIDDLAVGAPGLTFDHISQRGAVHIFFGNKESNHCML
jgi:hypothetical protein